MIPGSPNDRRVLPPAQQLTRLEDLARKFAPGRQQPKSDEQIAAEMVAEQRAENRKAERQEMSDRDARCVA